MVTSENCDVCAASVRWVKIWKISVLMRVGDISTRCELRWDQDFASRSV